MCDRVLVPAVEIIGVDDKPSIMADQYGKRCKRRHLRCQILQAWKLDLPVGVPNVFMPTSFKQNFQLLILRVIPGAIFLDESTVIDVASSDRLGAPQAKFAKQTAQVVKSISSAAVERHDVRRRTRGNSSSG